MRKKIESELKREEDLGADKKESINRLKTQGRPNVKASLEK